MCYNYEDMMESAARHTLRQMGSGPESEMTEKDRQAIAEIEEQREEYFKKKMGGANVEEFEKDESLYPGRQGTIMLLGENTLRRGYFGLLPKWAKKFNDGSKNFNARSETLLEKPTWRIPFNNKQRCVVFSSGFYETDKTTKKKYFFRVTNRATIHYAGLYNFWHDAASGEDVLTYAIITTEPNELIQPVHFRMPVILSDEDFLTWMKPQAGIESLLQVFKSFPANLMEMNEVQVKPKKKKNESPDLFS